MTALESCSSSSSTHSEVGGAISAVRDCWRRLAGPAQANPADQSLKAWLGAEGIQPGFHREVHQPRIAFFIGFVEQVERFFLFAEADVNECQLIGWEVMLCR